MDARLLVPAFAKQARTKRLSVIVSCAFVLLFLMQVHAQAQTTAMPEWASSLWWRGCASLDLDFYYDRYYINGNTTCDGTVGTVYTAGGGNTGVQNFIAGTGATFTRGGTSNITATGIPFYLQSNESFVSRASTATYFNSSGALSTAATNTARTDYEYNGGAWINEGTLIEPASTNLVFPSQGGFAGQNHAANTTLTDNTMAVTSPDGTNDASSFVSSGVSGYTQFVPASTNISAGTTYVSSVYVMVGSLTAGSTFLLESLGKNSTDGAQALFNLTTGANTTCQAYPGGSGGVAIGCGSEKLGNGWYRFWLAFQTSSLTTAGLLTGMNNTTYGTIYLYGQQLELGSVPTSYIPTTSATVTRSADLYSALGGSDNITSTAAPFYLASNQYYFSRASTATYFDSTGTLRYAPLWAARTNYTYNGSSWVNSGTLIEPAAANSIQNSTMTGAVTGTLGSGGSLPTNWQFNNGETGLSSNVVGTGTEFGMNYIDLSIYGTATSESFSVQYIPDFGSTGNDGAPASPGQVWSFSFYTRLVSGSLPANFYAATYINEGDSSVNYLTGSPGSELTTLSSSTPTRVALNGYTVSNSSTTKVFGLIGYFVPVNTAVNFTVRVYAPQLELGSAATSYIPTNGITANRAADQYTNPYGATYYNSQGFIQSAAAGVPRLDHDPTVASCSATSSCPPKGILIEQSQTNMVPGSQELFSNATYWCQNCIGRGTTMGDGVTATVSPDGTYDASSMNTTTTSGFTVPTSCPTITAGTTYTVSIYFQKAALSAPNQFEIQGGTSSSTDGAHGIFSLSTGAVSACTANAAGVAVACGTQSLPNNWYRGWVAFQTGSSTQGCLLIGNNGVTYGTSYIYGAQLETGSFPTSYIPTSTVAVTRPADLFTLPTTAGPGSGWYNSSANQGTLDTAGIIPYLSGTLTYPMFASIGGTSGNEIHLFIQGANGFKSSEIYVGGTQTYARYITSPIYVAGNLTRASIAFQNDNVNSAFDGNAGSANTTATIPTVTSLNVGADPVVGHMLYGWVNRVTYFPIRQPDTALPELTQ